MKNNIDWKGNKVSYISTNGFANIRDYDREVNDYYATEPKAIELLLELHPFNSLEGDVWEPACGELHLSKAMEQKGLTVRSSNIVDRAGNEVFDFLSKENTSWHSHIITNPPYKFAKEFIEKSLSIIPPNKLVAMFLPIRYLEGKARRVLFTNHPPKYIIVSSSRIKCAINGDFEAQKGGAMSYAWFVWEKGYKGETILRWFN